MRALAVPAERPVGAGGRLPHPQPWRAVHPEPAGWCSSTAAGPTPTGGPTWRPPSATSFRVLCLDLSGHGDSGHRAAYSLEQWTEEVMAVAAAAGSTAPR